MKRTIATKMIVMSNELRTRGSMPGAIRSEIITRSSALAAINHLRGVDAIAAIVALQTRVTQEARQKFRAHGHRGEDDVLVWCMRPAALRAEPVEHGNADRAHEVAIGAPTARLACEVEPERPSVPLRLLEQALRGRQGLERRACPAARDLEARSFQVRLQ